MEKIKDVVFGLILVAIVLVGGYFMLKDTFSKPLGAPINIIASVTNSSAVCGSTSSQFLAAASQRDFMTVSDLDATTSASNSPVFVCFGATCNAKTGTEIVPGGTYKMDAGTPYLGVMSCYAPGASGAYISYSVNQ